MADGAYCPVVIAQLEVPFLGRVSIRDYVQDLGHLPVLITLLQMLCRIDTMLYPPAWISSPGMLSKPGDFPFLSDFTASIISSLRIELSSFWSSMTGFTSSTEGFPCSG